MLITCTLVPERQRVNHTARLFGAHFPFRLEPTVYGWAERLSPDYRGGYWHFYTLFIQDLRFFNNLKLQRK